MKMSRTILAVAVFALVLAATANTLFAQQSGQQQRRSSSRRSSRSRCNSSSNSRCSSR